MARSEDLFAGSEDDDVAPAWPWARKRPTNTEKSTMNNKKRPRGPAPDPGVTVATLPRGPKEELRIVYKSFEGHPYTSLETWTKNAKGDWCPGKGTVSIRNSELADVKFRLEHIHDNLARPRPDGGK